MLYYEENCQLDFGGNKDPLLDALSGHHIGGIPVDSIGVRSDSKGHTRA